MIGKLGVAAAGVKLRGSIRNARRLIRGESGKWPERTPEAWYYCDVKTSSPSGVRPYQLVYGRQPNTCLGGRIQKIGNQSDGEDSSGWKPGSDASSLGVQQEMLQTQRARAAMEDFAKQNQTKRDAKNKKQYDRRHNVKANFFTAGEVVWKTDRQISRKLAANKLAPKWDGPYRIVKVTSSTAHLVAVGGKKGIIKGVRFEMLKRADFENAVGQEQ